MAGQEWGCGEAPLKGMRTGCYHLLGGLHKY